MSTPDRPEFMATDDSLHGELAYLARFLGDRPGTAPIVLRRLGELGDEARFDLARLRAERAVRLRRMPPRARRRRAAARVAAMMAFVVTGPSLLVAPAVAQEQLPAPVVREAAAPSLLLRVVDTGTGKPLAGVKVKTVAEEVVAVTDASGKATLPATCAKENVLSLERAGYPIVLVEGEKLVSRSLVSMRKFADDSRMALGLRAPGQAAAARAAAGVDDPAERLMSLALEHSRSKPLTDSPLLAAAPASIPPAAAPASVATTPTAAAPATVAAAPPQPVPPRAPLTAMAPAAPTTPAAAPSAAPPTAAPTSAMARAARAPKRLVKVAGADAKAKRSVAVAWEAPRERADKNVLKSAFADAKAPRAIRVVMRAAAPGVPDEPASPLGITSDQLAWIPPVPPEQVGGAIQPAPEAPTSDAVDLESGVDLPPQIAEVEPPAAAEAVPHVAPVAPVAPVAEANPAPVAAESAPQVPAATPPLVAAAAPAPVADRGSASGATTDPEALVQPGTPLQPVATALPVQQVALSVPQADHQAEAPVSHHEPAKPVAFDLASLPSAPKPPAHLLPSLPAPTEAPLLISPEEGVKRFATINLPVRPRFARPAPAQVASAPTKPQQQAQASPMARVREHLTASRAHLRYQVQPGDMLSSIAQRELGNAALWPVLYQANRDQLTNPRWLQVGLALKIPRTSTGLAAAGAKTYVVQAGDCLSTIAREHLGDMRKWPQIFAANRHLIKNPWLIFPGQRLVLPVYIATGVSESWADLAATATPPTGGGSPRALAD